MPGAESSTPKPALTLDAQDVVPQKRNHLIFISSGGLPRALEAAAQVLRETAFPIDLDKGTDLVPLPGALWPRRTLKYLLRGQAFLRVQSVREMADHFAVTPAYLSAVFRNGSRLSPTQLLLGLKLCYAAYLRQTTTLGVDKMARCCGFYDGHHLSRLFRQKIGVTLSDYPFEHCWRDLFCELGEGL